MNNTPRAIAYKLTHYQNHASDETIEIRLRWRGSDDEEGNATYGVERIYRGRGVVWHVWQGGTGVWTRCEEPTERRLSNIQATKQYGRPQRW